MWNSFASVWENYAVSRLPNTSDPRILCYADKVRQIHRNAWFLVLLSALLQIAIFPLPNLYLLCWVALAPLVFALLRARRLDTLQLREGMKLLPANPLQAFLLAYVSGVLWYAGTCYWIYNTMRQYGGEVR